MSSFERVRTGSGEPQPLTQVWYVSYGSNMCMERLRYYLAGGRPPHGSRVYPGARDARMPAESVSVELPGTVYFATESPVWTGGRAFYDADAAGRAWGRAHLVTLGQFSDIAAQEMYRQPGPGPDLDVTEAVRVGRAELGAGRYETLVHAGERAGVPLLTFTAPWRVNDVEWIKPSATYLSLLASGLLETGSWGPDPVAEYLSSRPGAAGHWTAETVRNLVRPLPG